MTSQTWRTAVLYALCRAALLQVVAPLRAEEAGSPLQTVAGVDIYVGVVPAARRAVVTM
ncbi:MAG TPA: hypothetical protein VJ437_01580 [Acidiferrobacterales bacterium]|nr:hypothetical protein [Acidiferrobacterales bacterium]